MITIKFDEAAGIIRATGVGFQTVAEVRQTMSQMAVVAADARRRCGRVRLLVDSNSTPVQSPEIIEEYGRHQTPVREPEDRMAVLVSSTLAKMQMKRNFSTGRERAFISKDAAINVARRLR